MYIYMYLGNCNWFSSVRFGSHILCIAAPAPWATTNNGSHKICIGIATHFAIELNKRQATPLFLLLLLLLLLLLWLWLPIVLLESRMRQHQYHHHHHGKSSVILTDALPPALRRPGVFGMCLGISMGLLVFINCKDTVGRIDTLINQSYILYTILYVNRLMGTPKWG